MYAQPAPAAVDASLLDTILEQRRSQSFIPVFFYDAAGNGAGGHPRRARHILLPTDGREYEAHRGGRWQEAVQVRLHVVGGADEES